MTSTYMYHVFMLIVCIMYMYIKLLMKYFNSDLKNIIIVRLHMIVISFRPGVDPSGPKWLLSTCTLAGHQSYSVAHCEEKLICDILQSIQ